MMKIKNLFFSVLISVGVSLVIAALIFFKIIPTNHEVEIAATPRRYLDLNQWHSFNSNRREFFPYELVLPKSLYVLVAIHTIYLVWVLKIKNILFYVFYIPSLIVGMFAMVISDLFKHYFITGLNPAFSLVIALFVMFQIVSWVYLNLLLLKKIGAMKTER